MRCLQTAREGGLTCQHKLLLLPWRRNIPRHVRVLHITAGGHGEAVVGARVGTRTSIREDLCDRDVVVRGSHMQRRETKLHRAPAKLISGGSDQLAVSHTARWPTVRCSGVGRGSLTESLNLASAPCASSSRTVSEWPRDTATCSGVCPLLVVVASTLAPAWHMMRTHSVCPLYAALCSAVHPDAWGTHRRTRVRAGRG